MTPMPVVTVTGSEGFVAKNLIVRLREIGIAAIVVHRRTPEGEAAQAIAKADLVFHLAGANRPENPEEFHTHNVDYSQWVIEQAAIGGRRPVIVFASSTKAEDATDYGNSKRAAEALLEQAGARDEAIVRIYRLPNIFGKWCRPNYNSAVATFCHNVARGLPIRVNDPAAPLQLLYIDDLLDQWIALIADMPVQSGHTPVERVYDTTVGGVAEQIRGFAQNRDEGVVAPVGSGLTRALYSTFISYLPQTAFSYDLQAHVDPRGSFSEMLKTHDSGQFSFFTAHPGVTRGGHYHHSKVEKFLIVAGEALFRFRNILTGETHEIRTSGAKPVVVETIPGWTHDVSNVGHTELISLLWANEIFDRARPDTVQEAV